jgi:hypothetical protein
MYTQQLLMQSSNTWRVGDRRHAVNTHNSFDQTNQKLVQLPV